MAKVPHQAELPKSLTAFREVVRAAKGFAKQEALLKQILAEESGRDGAGAAVTEVRLLEFVREPRTSRQDGIALPQSDAWIELVERRSARFAKMLRRWLRAKDDLLASEAGWALAWMGMDQDLGRILRGLRTGSWRTRRKIAEGLWTVAEDRRCSARFRDAVYKEMAAWASGERPLAREPDAEEAVSRMIDAMLAMNHRSAMNLLKSERALRIGNMALGAVVRELASQQEYYSERFGKPVDPRLLWALFEAIEGRDIRLLPRTGDRRKAEELSRVAAQAHVLQLASDQDPACTAREARRLLKTTVPAQVRSVLKQTIRRCKGVPEADAALRTLYRRPRAFGRNATLVLRAEEFREHMLGDGLNGYFSNLGERWREASGGMRLAGSTRAAAILERAAKVVMAYGSLNDNRRALNAMIALDEAGDQRLRRLENELWKELDLVEEAVGRYIASHVKEFAAR